MLLSGCAPRMSQAVINDIKRIVGYALWTKPQDNPTHYNFDLTTEKLNDDGSEYRIFFRDKNELVRIKYLKVQEAADVNLVKMGEAYYKDYLNSGLQRSSVVLR